MSIKKLNWCNLANKLKKKSKSVRQISTASDPQRVSQSSVDSDQAYQLEFCPLCPIGIQSITPNSEIWQL